MNSARVKWQTLSSYNDRSCVCNASQGIVMFSNSDKELKTLALTEPDADGLVSTNAVDQAKFGEVIPLSLSLCLEKDLAAGADSYGVEFLSLSTSELQSFTVGPFDEVLMAEFDPSGELLVVVASKKTMVFYGENYSLHCDVPLTALPAWATFNPTLRHYRSNGGCMLACLDQDGNLSTYRDSIDETGSVVFKKLSGIFGAIPKEIARKHIIANIIWDVHGKYFVLPAESSVMMVSVDGNDLKSRYLTRYEKASVNAATVCKVTTGDMDGRSIVIGLYSDGSCFGWDVANRLPMLLCSEMIPNGDSIWNMIWSERKVNEASAEHVLMLTTSSGLLGSMRLNNLPSSSSEVVASPVIKPMTIDDDDDDRVVIRRSKEKSKLKKVVRFDDDGGDDNIFGDKAPAASSSASSSTVAVSSLEEKESVAEDKPAKRGIMMKMKKHDEDDDEFDDDDDDLVALPVSNSNNHFEDDVDDDVIDPLPDQLSSSSLQAQPAVPLFNQQDPFQPSSTMTTDKRNYLCWNEFGAVVVYHEDSYNTIEIEFTQASQGRNIRLTDHYGYTCGWLGMEGVFLATDGSDGGDDKDDGGEDKNMLSRIEKEEERKAKARGSMIYFKAFSSLSTTGEWSLTLPVDEEVICMTAGSGWLAVATTKGLIRIFTTGGLQDEVFWAAGPIVSMAGRGRYLAMLYHSALPIQDSQMISCKWIDLVSRTCIADCRVGVCPLSELTWVGISDRNHVAVMDDAGRLSLLINSCGWQWIPVLDVELVKKQNTDDHYWPIAVRGDTLTCVLLKGNRQYPEAYPRPVTCALSLEVPLISSKNTPVDIKSFMAASVTQSAMLNMMQFERDVATLDGDDQLTSQMNTDIETMELNIDKSLLRLFQKYCELPDKRLLDRAQDIAAKLHLPRSLDIALRISHHCGLNGLSKRINEIQRMKTPVIVQQQRQQMQDEEEDRRVSQCNVGCKRKLDFDEMDASKAISSNLSPVTRHEQEVVEVDDKREFGGETKRRTMKANEEPAVVVERKMNVLSSKVDLIKKKQENDTRSSSSSAASGKSSVPPQSPVRESAARSAGMDQVTSPFSIAKTFRKMQDSPKKTGLSRQSSFSATARAKTKQDKHILT